MSSTINLSKVQSLQVIPTDGGHIVQVTYKSSQKRGFTFGHDEPGLTELIAKAQQLGIATNAQPLAPVPPEGGIWCEWCDEHPALPGEPCDVCRKLGADPAFRYEQTGKGEPAPESTPEPETVAFISLTEMLGLAGEQAQQLEGTTRLNFWRNGSLNVQVEHGCRATKIKLPTAVVTDAQLDAFFAGWGWQKLGQKPYYKPTPASLVRI